MVTTSLWQTLLIHVLPPLLVAIPAILAWISSNRNKQAIQDVHVSINSRMDQLLRVVGDAKFAEGVKAQTDAAAAAAAVKTKSPE